MKNEAVMKINKMGKVGGIIILVMKILLIIGFVGSLIGFITTSILPDDLVTFTMHGDADVVVDLSRFGADIFDKAGAAAESSTSSIAFNGSTLDVTDISHSGSIMNITASGQLSEFNFSSVSKLILVGMIDITMLLITMFFAGFLAKAFKTCESPFEENVIRKMRNFAISLIPWAVLSTITDNITNALFAGKDFYVHLGINLNMVFVILIVFALTYIFKYGGQLQKEADETL